MVSLRTLTQDIVAGLDTGKDAERYFGTPTGIPFSSVYIMLSPFGATEGKIHHQHGIGVKFTSSKVHTSYRVSIYTHIPKSE